MTHCGPCHGNPPWEPLLCSGPGEWARLGFSALPAPLLPKASAPQPLCLSTCLTMLTPPRSPQHLRLSTLQPLYWPPLWGCSSPRCLPEFLSHLPYVSCPTLTDSHGRLPVLPCLLFLFPAPQLHESQTSVFFTGHFTSISTIMGGPQGSELDLWKGVWPCPPPALVTPFSHVTPALPGPKGTLLGFVTVLPPWGAGA